MYIRVFNLKDMEKADYERILKRSEVETDSVLNDVAKVIEDVKTHGDQALVDYTGQFDQISIKIDQIRVSQEEIKEAYKKVDGDTIAAIRTLAGNVKRFHAAQMSNKMWSMEVSPDLLPDKSTFPWKSGLLRSRRQGLVSFSGDDVSFTRQGGRRPGSHCLHTVRAGRAVPPGTLIACDICGADAVFRVGGSQAVAAMAHGTQTVPKVDKIVGPGSKWVLAAFKLLYGQVEIGTHAGPGEGLIIADESADPEFAAADICIQAEHGLDSAGVLVTHVKELAYAVQAKIGRHIERLNEYRKNFVVESLKKYGAIIITESLEESISFANEYSVEHLEIMTGEPLQDMQKIKNAGGIYLGHYTPLSTGCFGSGPNHVLPTGRRAVVSGGLKTADFYKAVTFEYFSKEGLANLREAMVKLADYEGFPAHGNAILERFARD